MNKPCLLLLVLVFLVSACSTASALEQPQPPFQSGVEISKPTYTPAPTVTPPPVDPPAPVSTESPGPSTFAADAFVVIENLSPATGSGYDSTTPYDTPPTYSGSKYIQVDISEQHMYVYDGGTWSIALSLRPAWETRPGLGSLACSTKFPTLTGQPGISGCLTGWASTGQATCRTASMRFRSCPMERLCGPVIWARLSHTAAWCWIPTTLNCYMTGRILARLSRSSGKVL